MINIAHISDIHFGKNFNNTTWKSIESTVINFGPDLIIVSGDLVDDPSPAHLLVAKCVLNDLSARARDKSQSNGRFRAAELIVVPGNHDVFESGVAMGFDRLDWFERIFYSNDTSMAEKILKNDLGVDSLCFDTAGLGISSSFIKGWWNRLYSMARARTKPTGEKTDFRSYLHGGNRRPSVKIPNHAPVLLALLELKS